MRIEVVSHCAGVEHLDAQLPGGRWILKSPDHLFALDDIRKVYPDAQLVLVHRDPVRVLASVAKTGRCVIVHEAARTGGFGGEIAALIAERGLMSLLAPVARVTGYDTIIPLPRLEQAYMPSVDRIVAAARQVYKFG